MSFLIAMLGLSVAYLGKSRKNCLAKALVRRGACPQHIRRR